MKTIVKKTPTQTANDLEYFALHFAGEQEETLAGLLMDAVHAIRTFQSSMDFRPMDCAPLDGKEVLLKVESRAGIPGKMLVGHYMPGGHCIEDHPPIDRGWYFWNGCSFDLASKPIAWMPLPEANK
jgi:hypothetical protein